MITDANDTTAAENTMNAAQSNKSIKHPLHFSGSGSSIINISANIVESIENVKHPRAIFRANCKTI